MTPMTTPARDAHGVEAKAIRKAAPRFGIKTGNVRPLHGRG
jgi:hypothetical protein